MVYVIKTKNFFQLYFVEEKLACRLMSDNEKNFKPLRQLVVVLTIIFIKGLISKKDNSHYSIPSINMSFLFYFITQ